MGTWMPRLHWDLPVNEWRSRFCEMYAKERTVLISKVSHIEIFYRMKALSYLKAVKLAPGLICTMVPPRFWE